MSRFRTQWLALLAALLLVTLSASSAFAVHPERADNRGQQVSAFVHSLIFGSDEEEEVDEQEEEEAAEEELEEEAESEDELEEEEADEEDSDNHGQCVREVAKSLEIGGVNQNHGGAVSFAARVTCWQDGEEDEDNEELDEEVVDEDEELDEVETTSLQSSDRPGKSGAAHERAGGKNKVEKANKSNGRGNGHGPGRGKR